MSQSPIKVAVTGAAGQIGYSLLFRIASGEVFGKDTPVEINLVELPVALKAAEGTAMELDDCAYPLLKAVNVHSEAKSGFNGVNWALLVGSKPRGPGMERNDLLTENGNIFSGQGKALEGAASDVRIAVVGNPCNTNALIALHNAKDIPPERFSAMTMLDENRARSQLASKLGGDVSDVKDLIVWGNHSSTMYPDFENATYKGKPIPEAVGDESWLKDSFLTAVQKRGAAIIAARGKSSAASAANALIDHVRLLSGMEPGRVFSAAIATNGEYYDIPKGLIFSFPLKSENGKVTVVDNIKHSDFAKQKIKQTTDELIMERDVVKNML